MWHRSKVQGGARHWDHVYRNDEGKWRNPQPDVQDRINEALNVAGRLEGKHVLDLGGGALLARHYGACKRAVVVDISEEALRLSREVSGYAAALETVCMSALAYLQSPDVADGMFDLTICMGMLDYVGPHGLDHVIQHCPSPEMVLGTSCSESYLDYPERITIYSKRDVYDAFDAWGWTLITEVNQPSNILARWRKRNT